MPRAQAASMYLLTRVAPHAAGWSDKPEFYTHSGAGVNLVPVTAFPTKKAAEEARKRAEHAARESTPIGPFLRELLPERMQRISDAAKAAGLPLPDYSTAGEPPAPTMVGGHRAYSGDDYEYELRLRDAVDAWWASVAPTISPQANALMWDALFDDFHFYTVSRVLFEE